METPLAERNTGYDSFDESFDDSLTMDSDKKASAPRAPLSEIRANFPGFPQHPPSANKSIGPSLFTDGAVGHYYTPVLNRSAAMKTPGTGAMSVDGCTPAPLSQPRPTATPNTFSSAMMSEDRRDTPYRNLDGMEAQAEGPAGQEETSGPTGSLHHQAPPDLNLNCLMGDMALQSQRSSPSTKESGRAQSNAAPGNVSALPEAVEAEPESDTDPIAAARGAVRRPARKAASASEEPHPAPKGRRSRRRGAVLASSEEEAGMEPEAGRAGVQFGAPPSMRAGPGRPAPGTRALVLEDSEGEGGLAAAAPSQPTRAAVEPTRERVRVAPARRAVEAFLDVQAHTGRPRRRGVVLSDSEDEGAGRAAEAARAAPFDDEEAVGGSESEGGEKEGSSPAPKAKGKKAVRRRAARVESSEEEDDEDDDLSGFIVGDGDEASGMSDSDGGNGAASDEEESEYQPSSGSGSSGEEDEGEEEELEPESDIEVLSDKAAGPVLGRMGREAAARGLQEEVDAVLDGIDSDASGKEDKPPRRPRRTSEAAGPSLSQPSASLPPPSEQVYTIESSPEAPAAPSNRRKPAAGRGGAAAAGSSGASLGALEAPSAASDPSTSGSANPFDFLKRALGPSFGSRAGAGKDASAAAAAPSVRKGNKASAGAATAPEDDDEEDFGGRESAAMATTPLTGNRSKTDPRAFKKERGAMTVALFAEYNRRIFDDRLPADLEIKWNERLRTTAGVTHYKKEVLQSDGMFGEPKLTARVELSGKVLDHKDKLRRTLCHELCHVAAWLIDRSAKPPHGPAFRKWADRAMGRYPDLEVTTCHNYEIKFAHQWQCVDCGQEYGRHSNSIDTKSKCCGLCQGKLVYLGRTKPDGTPAKPKKEPTGFALFVKEQYASVRQDMPPGSKAADVMKRLGELYKSRGGSQEASGAAEGSGGGQGGADSESHAGGSSGDVSVSAGGSAPSSSGAGSFGVVPFSLGE